MLFKKSSAFSLIEIMIVVTIIGILATMVGPRIMKAMKEVKATQTKTRLKVLQGALQEYTMDVGRLPLKLDDLLDQPSDAKVAKRWKGPYVSNEEALEDAWGTPVEYNRPPTRFKKEFRYQDYELISLGKDLEESEDDIHVGE